MSATAHLASNGPIDDFPNYLFIPRWHRDWITEHAQKVAYRAFLEAAAPEFADGPRLVDPRIWENAGRSIIQHVHEALDQLEDPETIRAAQHFGAEAFLRDFVRLLNLSCRGGRA